ncbi:hypothetical protein ACFV4I_00545 [Nocardiopsis alba]|uniref:hypothetical protein n=1 Tax=Nocardiopsis alba TaxID=53437 RepID=UPI00364638BE
MADPDLHTGHMMTSWGHSSDHTDAHAAPRLQAQCPRSVIRFGETSVHFYALEAAGLHERPTLEALVFLLRQPRPRHSGGERTMNTGPEPLRFDDLVVLGCCARAMGATRSPLRKSQGRDLHIPASLLTPHRVYPP